MIPAYLLNSTAEFYIETTVEGSFGEQVQVFTPAGSEPVRLNQNGSSRSLNAGRYEDTTKRFTLFVNRVPPNVTEKSWAVVSCPNNYVVTGQVESIRYPSTMNHHAELSFVQKEMGGI